jgi:hypothetical protein
MPPGLSAYGTVAIVNIIATVTALRSYCCYLKLICAQGIQKIPNALCCEDHFEWHRMNCPTANPSGSSYLLDKEKINLLAYPDGQISEYFF